MKSRINVSPLSNTLLYVLSSALSALITFAALPIFTKFLSPAEYGNIGMFQSLYLGGAAFLSFSVNIYCEKKILKDNTMCERSIISNAIFFVFFITILLLIIPRSLFSPLMGLLGVPIQWYYFCVICLSSQVVMTICLSYFTVIKKASYFFLTTMGNISLNILLSLLLIIYFDMKSEGRVFGLAGAGIVLLITTCVFFIRTNKIRLDSISIATQKEIFQFGLKLLPHAFGFFILNFMDRIVVNNELGVGSAGIYILAVQLSGFILLFYVSANKAYLPWVYNKLNKKNVDQVINSLKHLFLFSSILFIFNYYLSDFILPIFISKEYLPSIVLFKTLSAGAFLSGLFVFLSTIVIYFDKTIYLSKLTFFSAISNVLLLMMIVPIFGLEGAIFVFVVTRLIQLSIGIFSVIKLLEAHRELGRAQI
ncbi:putative Wzx [Vibrio crassostreae]|nr:putative Wzx [Vibrio crassostreae]CAK2314005.1 putative Wzx [Vibrio crassostreae]CAK2451030.1 putative Wzx [Vibrio crassostreae]CAK2771502.1 putative Wzx [Vibrio crassostreae]